MDPTGVMLSHQEEEMVNCTSILAQCHPNQPVQMINLQQSLAGAADTSQQLVKSIKMTGP